MKNDKGMTLVELLVAIVLLSIIIMPLIGYMNQARKASFSAHLEAEAMRIAQMHIESLKSRPYSDIIDQTISLTSQPPFTEVSYDVNDTEDNKMKIINVKVYWRDGNNVNQSHSLVTYISKRE